jgi:hypothetical protein
MAPIEVDGATWEERMSQRARIRAEAAYWAERAAEIAARAANYPLGHLLTPGIPTVLAAELPPGESDQPRNWCTTCGLANPPMGDHLTPDPPCPRCGSEWRWFGRLADRDGTATEPPVNPDCAVCFGWERWPPGQEHFGWRWTYACRHWEPDGHGGYGSCRYGHRHHDYEVLLA